MEDYKKKYEQAMLRMNKWVEGSEIIEPKEVAEFIFPELKESEDERIRKFISHELACIRATDEKGSDRYEELTNAIAWLEKQGKQKPVNKIEPKFNVGDVIKNINNGDTVKIEQILDNYYCYSGWDGAATIHSDFSISEQDNWELVEQKPIEIPFGTDSELVEKTITIPNGCYAIIKGNKVILRKGEQKPAWSEEDKRMLGKVLECIRFAEDHYQLEKEDANNVSVGMWLLDHINPQPKQEWSKEDEKMWITISDLLWEGFKLSDGKVSWDKIRGWLLPKIIYLKDRVQPQPKSTWSEEDDDNIMMIEDRLSDYLDYIREDSTLTKHQKNCLKEKVIGYVNWLKSLKERVGNFDDGYKVGFSAAKYNQWKPSDEQKSIDIEKACEFLRSYRQDTHDGTGYIAGIVNDKTIEDFKNYMKGE